MNRFRCFLILIAVARAAPAGETLGVSMWQQIEIPLTSSGQYENPFTDVTVSATFIAPSRRQYNVEGFYNGGNSWRVRFMPTEMGDWSYVTKSSDKAMNSLGGHFKCMSVGGFGPVYADDKRPGHWCYASRQSFYYNGTKCFPLFGLTKSSKGDAYGGWDTFVEYCTKMKFNSIMVAPYYRASGIPHGGRWPSLPPYATVWPARGNPDKPGDINRPGRVDFDRFYLPQWDKMDEIIREMQKREIIAYIVLHPGGARSVHNTDKFRRITGLTEEQEELYFRYAVARLASFTNIRWSLAWNYTSYRDARWAKKMGKFIRKHDPYQHPLSIHGDEDLRLGQEDWVDFVIVSGRTDDPEVYERARSLKKPIVNDNYGTEGRKLLSADQVRRVNWYLAVSGAYGSYGNATRMRGNFSYLLRDPDPGAEAIKILYETMAELPWPEMAPDDKLLQGRGRCLACPGKAYLVYMPAGGQATLDLSDENEPMTALRIDPRTGTRKRLDPTQPGKRLMLTTPTRRDWAFVIGHFRDEPIEETK